MLPIESEVGDRHAQLAHQERVGSAPQNPYSTEKVEHTNAENLALDAELNTERYRNALKELEAQREAIKAEQRERKEVDRRARIWENSSLSPNPSIFAATASKAKISSRRTQGDRLFRGHPQVERTPAASGRLPFLGTQLDALSFNANPTARFNLFVLDQKNRFGREDKFPIIGHVIEAHEIENYFDK